MTQRLTWRDAVRACAIALLLGVVAAALVYGIYGHTLSYGFDYDDYHLVRPYTRAEVLGAFVGSWDSTGIEKPFYRPLTTAFYAWRFATFGPDAGRFHLLSLVLFGLAAVECGLLVYLLTRGLAAALLATCAFCVNPAMPLSLVVWTTNQMHLLAVVGVFGSLIWWIVAGARAWAWMVQLVLFAPAVLLVKEDGMMLLPCLLAWQALAWWLRSSSPAGPRWWFFAGAAIVVGGLLIVRHLALGGIGGYGVPQTAAELWRNLLKGPLAVFTQLPHDRPWQTLAAWSGGAVIVSGLVIATLRRGLADARFLIAGGIVMVGLFDLPFALVSKAEQFHFIATGAVLVLAGAALAWWQTVGRPVPRALLIAALAVPLATMAMVSRDISGDIAPCSPVAKSHDRIVVDWAVVPDDLREWLRSRLGDNCGGSANPARALPFVAYGVYGWESAPDGTRFRWTRGLASIYLRDDVTSLTVPISAVIPRRGDVLEATVRLDGVVLARLVRSDADWVRVPIQIPRRPRTWWRTMARLDIEAVPAWTPAVVWPGSTDHRELGVRLGEITLVTARDH